MIGAERPIEVAQRQAVDRHQTVLLLEGRVAVVQRCDVNVVPPRRHGTAEQRDRTLRSADGGRGVQRIYDQNAHATLRIVPCGHAAMHTAMMPLIEIACGPLPSRSIVAEFAP